MLKEFERIVLTKDLTGTSFEKGDVGIIVQIYPDYAAYEVEFFAVDGTTLGVETVLPNQIKSTMGIKRPLHIKEKIA